MCDMRPTIIARRTSLWISAYLLVVIFGVAARIESFPLTWAPMYANKSSFYPIESYVLKKPYVLEATQRDGTRQRLTVKTLNVADHSFRRLCTQRIDSRKWCHVLLESVNSTLGYAPEDPRYIVELAAPLTVLKIPEGSSLRDIRVVEKRATCSLSNVKGDARPRAKSWQHPAPDWAAGGIVVAVLAAAGGWVFRASSKRAERRFAAARDRFEELCRKTESVPAFEWAGCAWAGDTSFDPRHTLHNSAVLARWSEAMPATDPQRDAVERAQQALSARAALRQPMSIREKDELRRLAKEAGHARA